MAKFKVNNNKNYSIIANCIFKDTRLSWKAKGILANMLSLPDNWDYSLAGLEQLASDGTSATRSALKELETFGYLIRRPIRENGRIKDWEYLIFEEPQEEKQVLEKPLVENQQVEKPLVENRTQLSTNKKSTNQSNKKEIDIDAEQVVAYLNEKAGTRFKPVESNLKFIVARLKDYTVDDLKTVIDKKVAEWKGTTMQQYLRPETLFNATKFESYYGGLKQVKEKPKAAIVGGKEIERREYTNEQLDGLFTKLDE